MEGKPRYEAEGQPVTNVDPAVVEVKEEVKENVNPADAPEAPKKGPADDIRVIQALLANGIFPGNVAPQIVKAYQLLENMAVTIEKHASKS